jgi:hypothetical protein
MLFGWMKNLVIYLILSGIIMNLSPGENYKKYINFLMGLIVILIIAEPIAYIFNIGGGDIDRISQAMDEYMEFPEANDYYTEDYYDLGVKESIKLALEDEGIIVQQINVISDTKKNIIGCHIYLNNNVSIDDAEVKNIICHVYKMDFDSIYIVRR